MNRFVLMLLVFLLCGGVIPFTPATGAGSPQTLPYLDQLPPLIDREIFFDDPEITGGQISPNGEFISFRRPYNGVMNIWVKAIDEPFEDARPITAETARPIPAYFWSRDSRFILYVRDFDGDENFNVYAVDPAGEPDLETGVPTARNLTDMRNVRAQIFSVPRNTPEFIIVGLNDRDPRFHDVYRLHIGSGEKELLFKNDQNIIGWTTDDDGNLRFAYRQTQDGGTEILAKLDDQLIQVYQVSAEESAAILRFHPDGNRVYMMTNKGDDVDLIRLVLFDPSTGEKTLVEEDPEGKVDFAGALFSDLTDELLATYYIGDRMRMYFHNDQFRDEYLRIREKLPEGDLYFVSSTKDEQRWLISVSRDVDPGVVYLYDRETGEVTFQYRPRPNLPTEYLAEMIPIRYTARDGLEIPAYLTVPKGVEPKNLAVIVLPHGGPWARDTWGYRAEVQFLANRGYAVFQPNFRGSTGYGKAFLNAGNREWGTGYMQHDITDGVRYLIEQGIADPERVGIYGGSYGGFATLAGLAFTPDLYAAGISFVGPSNIITLLESIPPYWEPIRRMFEIRVGDINDPEDRKRLREQSPLFSAENIRAPLLVVQGANDPRVIQRESDQIVAALRDLGRQVEYIVAPDEGHGFTRPENRIAFYVAMERFFAHHLGGRHQEDVREEIARRLADITVDIADVTLPEAVDLTDVMTGQLPAFSVDMVKPRVSQFRTVIESGGQEITMLTTRTVEYTEWNGYTAWRIIDQASGPMGAVADTFYLDFHTLIPFYRSATQGMAVIQLTYGDASIKGTISVGPQVQNVDVSLDSPILGDGGALDVALAALPLEDDYKAVIPTFDIMRQRTVNRLLEVAAIERITVPAGEFRAFKLELTPVDDHVSHRTVWVSVEEPRRVLRSVDTLPPMMGGGTITTELQAIELGEM